MEKNYKNHLFRAGDEIYHPVYGKGKVLEIGAELLPIVVEFGDMFRYFSDKTICLLSFTPYELNSNWERPFEPKDGDVVYREYGSIWSIDIHKECRDSGVVSYARLFSNGVVITRRDWTQKSNIKVERAATDEEKKQLFDAIAKEGKRWNAEKKCIEDDDTPNIGDKCIFGDDDPRIFCVDILKGIYPERVYMFETDYRSFDYCVKYSDEKLIELMNKGL